MEAALVNVLSPGDAMLALVAGNFGERWAAHRQGARHGRAHARGEPGRGRRARAPWPGVEERPEDPRGVRPAERVAHGRRARREGDRAAVVRGRDALLVVDAISGAGAMPLETEAWGVDVVVVGSQKSLALPPGLAFVALARAPGSASTRRSRRASTSTCSASARRRRRASPRSRRRSRCVVALEAALGRCEAQGGVDALVDERRDARGHDARGRAGAGPAAASRRAPTATR